MSVIAQHPRQCACCRTDCPRIELRRELSAAERHVDVHGLVAALEDAKLALHAEIVAEQRRLARKLIGGQRARLVITPRMAKILAGLFARGQQAALEESASMGVSLRKRLEAEPAPMPPGTHRGYTRLQGLLRLLNTRVVSQHEARMQQGAGDRPEMLRALTAVPGALNAAGQVVSKTLMSGMGDVFRANADAFSGWQYTAVLDGGTCDECDDMDGSTYPTWSAITEVLPDGGPNPSCFGGDRCRCRALPTGAA